MFFKKDLSLKTLFFINFIGSLYGFYWYKDQLLETSTYLWVFVPDSPTATALFSLALYFFIVKKPKPFLTLLACIWLIKYGLWAVIINTHFLMIGGNYSFTNFHLTLSHFGMALQGLLFIKLLAFSENRCFLLIPLLMILSDVVDYVVGVHPWLFSPAQFNIALISAILLTLLLSIYVFHLYFKNKTGKACGKKLT